MVSKPMPELQPVTSAVLPLRSMPAVTSSAVERYPKLLNGTPAGGGLSVQPAIAVAIAAAGLTAESACD